MKVEAINFYSQNRVKVTDTAPKKQSGKLACNTYMDQTPLGTFNHFALSFKSKSRETSHYDINLNALEIKGLPCPCCGKTMIPSREFSRTFNEYNLITENSQDLINILQEKTNPNNEFIRNFDDAKLNTISAKELINTIQQKMVPSIDFTKIFNGKYLRTTNGKELINILQQKFISSTEFVKIFNENNLPTKNSQELINTLQPYEDNMHETEKLVFKSLKQLALKKPNASLNSLICILQPHSIDILKNHQTQILKELIDFCSELPTDEANKLKLLIQNSHSRVFEDDASKSFKRKKFIEKLTDTMADFPETSICNKIYNKALRLNNSVNDFNAFVVKYARRDSKEICRRLVLPSVSTIEHIHPHCDFKDKIEADKMENLILEDICNNDKGDKRLKIQVLEHPEMPENTQKYYDAFIEKMNNGEIDKRYTPEMLIGSAKTMEIESEGLLKINLSKLKPLLTHC